MAGRAATIVDFCRGFSAGAVHDPLPADALSAMADGWSAGRLMCREALIEYLRQQGHPDLKDQTLDDFLHSPRG